MLLRIKVLGYAFFKCESAFHYFILHMKSLVSTLFMLFFPCLVFSALTHFPTYPYIVCCSWCMNWKFKMMCKLRETWTHPLPLWFTITIHSSLFWSFVKCFNDIISLVARMDPPVLGVTRTQYSSAVCWLCLQSFETKAFLKIKRF